VSRLLLDTHALLWWLGDDPRLGSEARDRIAADETLVSVVSLWEIVIKVRIGKLEVDFARLTDLLDSSGMSRLPILDHHLTELVALPTRHRDPFDHLLIAQAIAERAMFVTADQRAALYPVERLDC
jgi:PIN domain nuclease of toxin-antitoxin system